MLDLELQYREAEHARRAYQALLEAAREGMVLIAPDQRLLVFNQRFSELFDIDPESAGACRLDDLRPRIAHMFGPPGRLAEQIADALRDAEQPQTEIVVQTWPRHRELELFSSPVRDSAGAHLGRLYIFRDVTREREADRLKSEFVALASHELRAPLTAIKGFLDVLLSGDFGDLADQQRQFLDIARTNADRLVALVSDLLDMAQIESGKVLLRRAPLDLAALIRDSASTFQIQIAAKQQQLTLDLEEPLPPVFGDAARITQVLTNLLSNAHKYTPPGGAIRVLACAEAGRVRVDVWDNGIGLLPDDLDRLFTKFFRSKNRLAEDAGGTGLGLAISRLLVELHGGTISAASSFGQGSTFSVLLPALEAV